LPPGNRAIAARFAIMAPMAQPEQDTAKTTTLSVCMIVHNEEHTLPDCLASVAFAQELVVVDSGSSDRTREIARTAGGLVVEQPWLGFAAQRNVALDHAHGDWVLELDADERVSLVLGAQIQRFLANVPVGVDMCGMPRREILVGHYLGASAKYPKYGHRLFRRDAYRHDESRTVHEGLTPNGVVHPFEGELTHLLASSWREAVRDTWRYARLEAGQMQAPRSFAAYVRGAVVRPAAKLLYRLMIDGGWRDGWPGVVRIGFDCATDSIVWTRHLLGSHGVERGSSGVSAGEHYGSRRFHQGCLRVVGVAVDKGAMRVAQEWLGNARAGGADAVLISRSEEGAGSAVRVRPLAGHGPLALTRALDAEEQLRPIDAVVAFGRTAGLLVRCVPPGLRGVLPEVTERTDPASVSWTMRADVSSDAR
jgi:hypothetical protein